MSDRLEDPKSEVAEEVDPGEPIRALARFEHDVSSGLVARIRRTVQWRTNVGQLASFSVTIPLVVLRELWSVLTNRPIQRRPRKEASNGKQAP
jgi:hypothetical protein